jgi:hypothetical protein
MQSVGCSLESLPSSWLAEVGMLLYHVQAVEAVTGAPDSICLQVAVNAAQLLLIATVLLLLLPVLCAALWHNRHAYD